MKLEYSYLGKQQTLPTSHDGVKFLTLFAAQSADSELHELKVTANTPAMRTAAARLEEQGILALVPSVAARHSFKLTSRGLAVVSSCRERLLADKEQPKEGVFFTYRGVEPNILLTADAAAVLDQFKPYAPGIYSFEPGRDPSGAPRKTFGEMVNLGIMVNVAADSETTMFILTGLGRNLLQEMQHYKALAAKPKTNPAAWRYKYADEVEESRAWSYTDEERLIVRLREDENYIIQKLDVRKEEE